jgi:hypothetical protein
VSASLDRQPKRLQTGCMATFTIRIPDELQDRIKTSAEKDKRSVNAEIEWMLESFIVMRQMGEAVGAMAEGNRDEAYMKLGNFFKEGGQR